MTIGQKTQSDHSKSLFEPNPAFDAHFSRIIINCAGPLQKAKSACQYILTILCASKIVSEYDLMMIFQILSDVQTDFGASNTDLSPSISNDQLSGSQLCGEQHSEPEISPLFERALDENEMSQVPVCYYVKMTF